MQTYNLEMNQALQIKLFQNLESVLDEFGIDLERYNNRLSGPCPVHGGDNPRAFAIYLDEPNEYFRWMCFTHRCEKTFIDSPIGLVRGLLSQKYGNKQTVTYGSTIKWIQGFLQAKLGNISFEFNREKNGFARQINSINKKVVEAPEGWSIKKVRERIDIPANYYINRGFDKGLLKRYDVGESKVTDRLHPLFNRVVVPVFDSNYDRVLGFTGRSLSDKCPKCNFYHTGECPNYADLFTKWYNYKFNSGFHLYNYWFAKSHINSSNEIILCEGPGDVWKLEMAGIKNAVALFGKELTDCQQILLEKMSLMRVVVMLDNDEAGLKGKRGIIDKIGNLYKLYIPEFNYKDIGEVPIEEVKTIYDNRIKWEKAVWQRHDSQRLSAKNGGKC